MANYEELAQVEDLKQIQINLKIISRKSKRRIRIFKFINFKVQLFESQRNE